MLLRKDVKQAGVLPFSSALIGGTLSLAGAFLLAKAAWGEPSGRVWGIGGVSLLFVLLALQLWRIHVLYESIDSDTIENVPLLRRALNETVRTFTWGNVVFLLAALAVFQFHLMK